MSITMPRVVALLRVWAFSCLLMGVVASTARENECTDEGTVEALHVVSPALLQTRMKQPERVDLADRTCEDLSEDCLEWIDQDIGCDTILFDNGTMVKQLCPSLCGACGDRASVVASLVQADSTHPHAPVAARAAPQSPYARALLWTTEATTTSPTDTPEEDVTTTLMQPFSEAPTTSPTGSPGENFTTAQPQQSSEAPLATTTIENTNFPKHVPTLVPIFKPTPPPTFAGTPTPTTPLSSAPALGPNGVCTEYMDNTGCGWTFYWNCPGQTAGTEGNRTDDGTTGYTCCCEYGLWKPEHDDRTPGFGPRLPTGQQVNGSAAHGGELAKHPADESNFQTMQFAGLAVLIAAVVILLVKCCPS